jgi:ribonuclease P protein component
MLPKENRLRKKKDFEKVFQGGRRAGEKNLSLRARENSLPESRFGFVVPRKHFRKAVLRNKLKRRLRECVRKELYRIKNGYDVVVLGRPGLENLSFVEIKEEIERLLSRTKLLKNDF